MSPTHRAITRRASSLAFALAVALFLALVACSTEDTGGPGSEGSAAGDCSDRVDNDGDGRTDCYDPGCATSLACSDGDILDTSDSDADGVSPGAEGSAGDCSDSIDNDSDGLVDCYDPGCATSTACGDSDVVLDTTDIVDEDVAPTCCPLDPPSCDCTHIGGSPAADGTCASLCDATPVGWVEGVDENGCPVYTTTSSDSCL